MTTNRFVLFNGRAPGDHPAHYTFTSSNGSSTIDLLWILASKVDIVKDLAIKDNFHGSDHFPVVLELLDPLSISAVPEVTQGSDVAPVTCVKWNSHKR